MSVSFVKEINDLIADAILESPEEEILSTIGRAGYPSWDRVREAKNLLAQAVAESRASRLERVKASFIKDKASSKFVRTAKPASKNINDMIADIVQAMQSKGESIPNGLLVAFREQSKQGSEQDIAEIWENLVSLGLIDTDQD